MAKKYDYPIRCFYFERTKQECFHNDRMRKINLHRKHISKKVGKIPVHIFFKKFEYPEIEEGFKEVKVVNNVPGPFDNAKDE